MKTLVISIILFAILAIGLGVYLGPDDLRACEAAPSERMGCQKADAIVAVSGGDTSARTTEAVRLYKEGWASKLIFSGAARDKSGPSNAEAMKRQAMAAGVPESAILIEESSETTRQNAEQVKRLLSDNKIDSVILVTSGYHQRRASLEFNSLVSDAVTIRNHPVGSDNQWSPIWWLTPTGWYLAISEFFKVIAFYIGGTR